MEKRIGIGILGILVAGALLLVPGGVQAKKRWNEIYPVKGAATAKVVIKGKERTYYSFSKDKPVRVEVQGPTKVKLYIRLEVPRSSNGLQDFKVGVTLDGKLAGGYSFTAERTKDVTYPGRQDVVPAKRKRLYVEVPEGVHFLEFRLAETVAPAARARFYVKARTGKVVMAAMSPVSYASVSTVVVGEQELVYYVATADKPAQMRIFGPTKIDVISRLDYDLTMKGKQEYVIAVSEKGRTINQQRISTGKSDVGSYRERPNLVPGREKKLTITVPAGEHVYEFRLAGTAAKSVSLRFLVPEEDLDTTDEQD